MASEERPAKDKWDILTAIGGALIPVSVAALGFIATSYLDKRQSEETRAQFYMQLLSAREEADSALRKDMFNTFVQSFIKPEFKDPATKVLGLELLEANFHDSIDLSPLFRDVVKEVRGGRGPDAPELAERLQRVVDAVKGRQVIALVGSGGWKQDIDVTDYQTIKEAAAANVSAEPTAFQPDLPPDELGNVPPKISVSVAFEDVDEVNQQLKMHLTVLGDDGKVIADPSFWLGLYDLPILNNTRLSATLRCAVVLNNFYKDGPAQITLLIFPASRASTNDKPYMDEMLNRLVERPKKAPRSFSADPFGSSPPATTQQSSPPAAPRPASQQSAPAKSS